METKGAIEKEKMGVEMDRVREGDRKWEATWWKNGKWECGGWV